MTVFLLHSVITITALILSIQMEKLMNKYYLAIMLLPLIFTQAVFAKQETTPKAAKSHYFLKLFDSNADGIVTETEFNSVMQERYQSMDMDKNGSVSLDEFKQYSLKRHNNWQQKKHAIMDLNKNGLISKQEFIEHSIKRAEKKFNHLDKNQDGQLSQEENIDKHTKKKQQLLTKMDKNHDGQLSREEHKGMTQRWFNKFDTNNDKVVGGDELKGRLHQ